MGYSKQKRVKVDKTSTKEGLFSIVNQEVQFAAARDLDAGAFKLWSYIVSNSNNHEFDLSSKDANDRFGIAIRQYNNAVAELIEKGYLVKTPHNVYKNYYVFYDRPLITKGNKEVEEEEKKVEVKEIIKITPKPTIEEDFVF